MAGVKRRRLVEGQILFREGDPPGLKERSGLSTAALAALAAKAGLTLPRTVEA